MIGLDTNVLVRYFTQDDPVQSKRATTFIESHCTEDHTGLADCLIAGSCEDEAALPVFTFDKTAARATRLFKIVP